MDYTKFSGTYTVRRLLRDDIPSVFALCEKNPQYYEHCPPFVTPEKIEADLKAMPRISNPSTAGGNIEDFDRGMHEVLDRIAPRHPVDLARIPRFNESEGHGPTRLHPVEDYFDDLARHLIWEIYHRDFQLFRYDFDNPGNKLPKGPVDLDEVHAKLGE